MEKTKIDKSIIDNLRDIFLNKKDDEFLVEFIDLTDDTFFKIRYEFLTYKKGDSGYYISSNEVELVDINEYMSEILTFQSICESEKLKYRVLAFDHQYTIDITHKLNRLSSVNINDVIEQSHLFSKKDKSIRLDLLRCITLQIK